MWILLAMISIMLFEENPYLHLSDSFLGIFPDFTMIKLLGLIGLSWAFFQVMDGQVQLRLLESKQARAFFLFLGTVIFALVASEAGIMALTKFLSIILFLPLVLTAVQTERNLRLALKACALTVILIFPYAYRQVLRFGGRLGVALYGSNYLALVLILLLPLAYVFGRQETMRWKRYFWMGGTGVIFLEIIMTASRGALIGLLFLLPLIALRLMKRRALALGGMCCLLLITVFALPTTMGSRLLASSFFNQDQGSGVGFSDRYRYGVLQAGMRIIQDNPIVGVGLGKFKTNVVLYEDVPAAAIAHNTYLELAAETGLPVLAAFLWLLYATFASLSRSGRLAASAGRRDLTELATAIQIGLAGYSVSAVFLSAQFEKFFWLIIFLSICLERIVKSQAEKANSIAPREIIKVSTRA